MSATHPAWSTPSLSCTCSRPSRMPSTYLLHSFLFSLPFLSPSLTVSNLPFIVIQPLEISTQVHVGNPSSLVHAKSQLYMFKTKQDAIHLSPPLLSLFTSISLTFTHCI